MWAAESSARKREAALALGEAQLRGSSCGFHPCVVPWGCPGGTEAAGELGPVPNSLGRVVLILCSLHSRVARGELAPFSALPGCELGHPLLSPFFKIISSHCTLVGTDLFLTHLQVSSCCHRNQEYFGASCSKHPEGAGRNKGAAAGMTHEREFPSGAHGNLFPSPCRQRRGVT